MSNWRHAALCRDQDPEIFHTVASPHTEAYAEYLAVAKPVCRACPVRERCLDYALNSDVTGVWGGTDEHERAVLRKKRVAVA